MSNKDKYLNKYQNIKDLDNLIKKYDGPEFDEREYKKKKKVKETPKPSFSSAATRSDDIVKIDEEKLKEDLKVTLREEIKQQFKNQPKPVVKIENDESKDIPNFKLELIAEELSRIEDIYGKIKNKQGKYNFKHKDNANIKDLNNANGQIEYDRNIKSLVDENIELKEKINDIERKIQSTKDGHDFKSDNIEKNIIEFDYINKMKLDKRDLERKKTNVDYAIKKLKQSADKLEEDPFYDLSLEEQRIELEELFSRKKEATQEEKEIESQKKALKHQLGILNNEKEQIRIKMNEEEKRRNRLVEIDTQQAKLESDKQEINRRKTVDRMNQNKFAGRTIDQRIDDLNHTHAENLKQATQEYDTYKEIITNKANLLSSRSEFANIDQRNSMEHIRDDLQRVLYEENNLDKYDKELTISNLDFLNKFSSQQKEYKDSIQKLSDRFNSLNLENQKLQQSIYDIEQKPMHLGEEQIAQQRIRSKMIINEMDVIERENRALASQLSDLKEQKKEYQEYNEELTKSIEKKNEHINNVRNNLDSQMNYFSQNDDKYIELKNDLAAKNREIRELTEKHNNRIYEIEEKYSKEKNKLEEIKFNNTLELDVIKQEFEESTFNDEISHNRNKVELARMNKVIQDLNERLTVKDTELMSIEKEMQTNNEILKENNEHLQEITNSIYGTNT